MAMSPAIQWEFRSTATASMVNGGGFKAGASGTDYSQQDAAQWTATDLACTTPSTTITSATGGFTAAAVGNVIHITAGTNFTVGWYEITAYTDANTLVLDRTPSPTLSGTGGTFYIGGALNVGGSLEDDFFEQLVGTNGSGAQTVWFYNNNTTTTVVFTPSELISMATDGGTQAPIIIEGYKTTRGDNPTGGSRPTLALGVNAVILQGDNVDVYNLQFTGTAATMIQMGTNSKATNCKFTNLSSTTGRTAFNLRADGMSINNEVISYFGIGALCGINGNFNFIGNYMHDCDTDLRANLTAGHVSIINNIIEGAVTQAILLGANANLNFVYGNTLYGSENTTGIGISITTGATDIRVLNNIIYGFATGISHADTQTVGYDDYNAYNNNDTDVSNWVKGDHDSALAPTFTSVAQVTGTAGAFVAGGSKLVDTSKNFTTSSVVAGDVVYIVSGTGVTAGNYLIDSISTTTNPNDTLNITVPASPGTNTTADKVYQITTGHNFAIGTNLKALGFPGAFQGGFTTGYMDIGAVQRQEPAASTGGGIWF